MDVGVGRVAVVGGGPCGMTAALLLARYGVTVDIFEAKQQRDPIGSKALCMQGDVLDILERVGCGQRLVDEGVTWTLGRTYYRDHELFQITFHDAGLAAFPPFVNVGQDRTEHYLEAQVEASDQIELHYGSPVVDLENAADGVTVAVDRGGQVARSAFDYAVAADGAGSGSRRLLGVDFPGRTFTDQFLICDIRAELPFEMERRFFFDPEWNPDRQVLIHPQADSVWRIDWQVPPDYILEEDEASGGLDRRIRHIVGEQDYTIVWKSLYRFHERVADRFQVGRTFFAGDAAHIVSPFGARGLNSGVQDAENIAWKLGFVLNGWAGTALADTYEEERRPAALENLRVAGATMEFLVPQTPDGWKRRRATLEAAVDNPDARRMVDSGQLAEPFWYTASSLTSIAEHDEESMYTAPGDPRPIVAGVLCPDAPCRVDGRPDIARIRQLFGRGWVLLANGEAQWATRAASAETAAPLDGFDLTRIEPDGLIAESLRLVPGTAALIRPDGHIAATGMQTEAAVGAAVRKAAGH